MPVSKYKNYSTAVDTRSLSVTSSPSGSDDNTTTVSLIYYENATRSVSALLSSQRLFDEDPFNISWIDITSQEVKFPGKVYTVENLNSSIVYGSPPNFTFNYPFNSAPPSTAPSQHISELFLYSPINASVRESNNPVSGVLVVSEYDIGPSGPGKLRNVLGMHQVSPYFDGFL